MTRSLPPSWLEYDKNEHIGSANKVNTGKQEERKGEKELLRKPIESRPTTAGTLKKHTRAVGKTADTLASVVRDGLLITFRSSSIRTDKTQR